MAISDATRKFVMKRDQNDCQFWHKEPYPATQVSHKDHQGIGGLPATHWKNLPGNLAASCGECHARLHGPGRVYRWVKFVPGDCMAIMAPNGQEVPDHDLWFYNRGRWEESKEKYKLLQGYVTSERHYTWEVARLLEWFKDEGIVPATDPQGTCIDVLDLGASLGLSTAEVKKRIRVRRFCRGLALESLSIVQRLTIDVAERLRKIPEKDLFVVAKWFADLPLAEAWTNFEEMYPGEDKTRKYRAFKGTYTEINAVTDEEARDKLAKLNMLDDSIIVKRGSVISGVRKENEDGQNGTDSDERGTNGKG